MSGGSATAAGPRVGFQTKLLIPVVACLVLLPLIVGAIVSRNMNRQEQQAGRVALTTAQGLFALSLDDRRSDLLLRFRPLSQSPALAVPAQLLADPASSPAAARETMRRALSDALDQLRDECQFIGYTGAEAGSAPIVPRRLPGPIAGERILAASNPIADAAAKTGETAGIVTLDNGAFWVVAVPVVTGGDQVLGVLTFVVRVDVSALQQLRKITGAEIVLVGGGGVIASTLPSDAIPPLASDGTAEIGGIHYQALMGTYDAGGPRRGFQYLLLLSSEESLRLRAEMNRLVTEVSLAGVLLSVVAVWFFTRRSTRPLRELRDTAEAVGRGDFSRRLERFANDECGDLAVAFNRMTGNLQQSRAELEKTVETLQATQAQLIQSEKLSAVGQFVSGVAHELNNPLAAVIGFSELLAQTSEDEKLRPHLEMISKSAQRCHKIVQNLLSFARQHPPERKRVSVNSVIEEVLDFMAYEFRTSNLAVERQLGEGLPTIMADGHQLQQVLVNILGNARQAVQAFRPDGKIVVRSARSADGGKVRVELIDNGPGIRPEHLSRIFDPFFTTKPVGKGTGLGLSLTYGIVKEHGGTIRVESVLGHGATFVIELPAAGESPPRPEAARVPARARGPAAPSGKTVLVVDDEEWLLALVADLLRQDGHVPVTARSGEEAVEILGRRRVDLIVSDWKMPGLSGAAFYEHLQAVHPQAAARILFMTGDVMNEALQEFTAREGKQCLSKPFPIEDFRAAVAAHLAAPDVVK